jgi:methylmalonyl-CoA/ethylmalonyl-CoA epimerase
MDCQEGQALIPYRLDHVAVAVPVLAEVAELVVGELGGVPAEGGPGLGFIGAQWRFLNDAHLEVLEPVGDPSGFLHRFLEQRGRGVHHVTFVVPDLSDAAERARAAGRNVVGYEDSLPSWKEAFLHPKSAHGLVIQLAESHPELGGLWGPDFPFPNSPPPAEPAARLEALRLNVHDLDRATALWAELLGGQAHEQSGVLAFRWHDSPLCIALESDPAQPEGAVALEFSCVRALHFPEGPHPTLGIRLVQPRL